MVITKKAFAKINLTLDVLNKRDDGYHDIVSLMQTISLFDTVTVEKADTGVCVSWNAPIEADEKNTAYRAACLMLEKYNINTGVNIAIDKKIPFSAGLGGGSADAAAVLCGLNELFCINAGFDELLEMGAQIGADVPFCLTKGAAVAEGKGERLVKLDAKTRCHVVLVKPAISVSTKEVYNKIDYLTRRRRPNMRMTAAAIEAGDIKNLGQNLFNVMELVTAEEYPIIRKLKQEMLLQGASGALMSGSGPTVFGIFQKGVQAINAESFFSKKYEGFETFNCELYYPDTSAAAKY